MARDIKKNNQPPASRADKAASQPEPLPGWLTLPPRAAVPYYTARPEDECLMEEVPLRRKILLYGMDGLGKTECMRKICGAISGQFTHALWVQYCGSFAESLLSQITDGKIAGFPENGGYAAFRRLLAGMGRNLLLFVDDIPDDMAKDPELGALHELEGTVILSARTPLPLAGFYARKIGRLDAGRCRKLFCACSGKQENGDRAALEGIIRLAGRHTLALEIIAKAAQAGKTGILEMYRALKEKGFAIHVPDTAAQNGGGEVGPQLRKLYDMQAFRNNGLCLRILQSFSALPCLPLSREDTVKFLSLDLKDAQALYSLSDLGWLDHTGAGFAMHPLVRQSMAPEHTGYDECGGIASSLLAAANSSPGLMKYGPFILHLAEKYQDRDTLAARILTKASLVHYNAGRFPEALELQAKAKDILEELYPEGMDTDLAAAYNNLAMVNMDTGSLPEALDWQIKAKTIWEALHPEGTHPDLVPAYNNLSHLCRAMNRPLEALMWQTKAQKIRAILYPDDRHPDAAAAFNTLSLIHQDMGDLREALRLQKKALGILQALYPDGRHANLAAAYHNLSMLYVDAGHMPEALKWMKKSSRTREALYPDGMDDMLAETYNEQSGIYRAMGDLPTSLKWQMKAIRAREALYPESMRPGLAESYNNLSMVLLDMGRLPEALEWQTKSLRMREALYPEGAHADLDMSYSTLSSIHYAMGNLEEALEWQIKSHKTAEALYPEGAHRSLAVSCGNLSAIYQAMGRLPEALEWQMKAKGIMEALYPEGGTLT